MKPAEYWIKHLNLQSHPEGGYFKETYRSTEIMDGRTLPERFSSSRNFSTAIYFLLRSQDRSVFHRIKSDELWHYHSGSRLTLYVLKKEGLEMFSLGPDPESGDQFQVIIPANHWFGARVESGDYTLSSCTVAPGFDFQDFEMAKRGELLHAFPGNDDLITQLTNG